MNRISKQAFKSYVIGYLNEYNVSKVSSPELDNTLEYKHFKLKSVANYLKVSDKYVGAFSVLMLLVSKFEVLISICIIVSQFFLYVFKRIFCTRRIQSNSFLMLGLNVDKSNFVKVMNSVEIKGVTIVTIPSVKVKFDEFNTVNLLEGVSFSDLCVSMKYSIIMVFYQHKKFKKNDFLFRSYSSFEYFISSYYVLKSSMSNTFIFDNNIDRWAYLFGHSGHSTIFIQHGILVEKIEQYCHKIGTVDKAYYISYCQQLLCEKLLFENKPIPFFRTGMRFTGNEKLVQNNLPNLLLVCNKLFFEKEKKIIVDVDNLSVNLYVKPHPADSFTDYYSLQKKYKFTVLDRIDYPEVDYVISYSSTLADEYEAVGKKIIRYDDICFNEEYINLLSEFKN